jgi:hypothetical protein
MSFNISAHLYTHRYICGGGRDRYMWERVGVEVREREARGRMHSTLRAIFQAANVVARARGSSERGLGAQPKAGLSWMGRCQPRGFASHVHTARVLEACQFRSTLYCTAKIFLRICRGASYQRFHLPPPVSRQVLGRKSSWQSTARLTVKKSRVLACR